MTDFANDFAAAFFNHSDDLVVVEDQEDEIRQEPGADPAKKARSLRRGLIKAANLQDMLLEK